MSKKRGRNKIKQSQSAFSQFVESRFMNLWLRGGFIVAVTIVLVRVILDQKLVGKNTIGPDNNSPILIPSEQFGISKVQTTTVDNRDQQKNNVSQILKGIQNQEGQQQQQNNVNQTLKEIRYEWEEKKNNVTKTLNEIQDEWEEDISYYCHGECKWDDLTSRQMKLVLKLKPGVGVPFLFTCGMKLRCSKQCKRDKKIKQMHSRMMNHIGDMNRWCKDTGLPKNASMILQLGDGVSTETFPVLVKARAVNNATGPTKAPSILLPFKYGRHFSNVMMNSKSYIPWEKKESCIKWRGATTGDGVREHYVKTLSDLGYDVKFTKVVQGKEKWLGHNKEYSGGSLDRRSLMKCRYALSLEGNDVATNLEWLMSHNSVMVMPDPTKEIWAMEGRLLPYVHYVPLNDPNDISSVIEWMDTHESECLEIVKNANKWMERFDRKERKDYILKRLMTISTEWFSRQLHIHNVTPK